MNKDHKQLGELCG